MGQLATPVLAVILAAGVLANLLVFQFHSRKAAGHERGREIVAEGPWQRNDGQRENEVPSSTLEFELTHNTPWPSGELDSVYEEPDEDAQGQLIKHGDSTARLREAFSKACSRRGGKGHWAMRIGAGDGRGAAPVDIAACDWNAMFVEPAPARYNVLRTQGDAMEQRRSRFPERGRILFSNAAVGERRAIVQYYYVKHAPPQCSSTLTDLSSKDPEWLQTQLAEAECSEAPISMTQVEVLPFSSLLERYHIKPQQVSFLWISADGTDATLVRHLPLDRLAPDTIVFGRQSVEKNGLGKALDHLARHHYDCYAKKDEVVAIRRGTA